MCFEGSSLFRLCLGKPRAQAGPRPDGCREGTCHHTASAPRGRWNPGGTGAGVPLKPAPFLCWETLFPVLNLGESQVCFVKGGGIPLAAPPESLHLSRARERAASSARARRSCLFNQPPAQFPCLPWDTLAGPQMTVK